ncbi:MAG: DUF4827 domain-containing protein [Muribaculaceae bacterium]|nr:DUF4827 domain-containing protein [Muribaculaceae bacterium]
MKSLFVPFLSMMALLAMVSCSDSKSYAELLTEENHTVNNFLSQHRVVDHIPADSVFEVGPDAPYYCIDDEGDVYMQVLDKGNDERAETDDKVYFRYMRYMLNYYVVGSDSNVGAGNADNMTAASTYFLFNNLYVETSTQYGTGIQLPMRFLGYDSKVNLVIKSQAGPTADMSYVVPYLYEISYYKPVI